MKTLIIEDEVLAAQALQKLLVDVCPEAEVLTILETIEDSVEWFENNEMPELLFVDIHLADGESFAIFEKVDVTCPVIFTTAYDEYALKAFEVNSIDYLLKPINKKDLQHALDKYNVLVAGRTEIQKFMTQIAYLYIDAKTVRIVTFDHKSYYFNLTLDELMEQLDPEQFYRANRQFIIARNAIKDISIWFGNKLCINLNLEAPEKIIVSKAKVSEFKTWLLN